VCRFCRNEQLLKEAMGVSSSNAAPFSRNHDIELELANSLLRVEQLLQRPSGASSEAAAASPTTGQLLLGKWVPVAPNLASDIIARSAAQNSRRVRTVNL
jgi:hypothetical protein